MTINWTKWDKSVIEKSHDKVFYYRDLYEGKHSTIFSRAKDLIDKGEIVDNILEGALKAQNVQTPYIVANISKLIPEIPAMLVTRSIGRITSSRKSEEPAGKKTDEQLDAPENETIEDPQQKIIEQVEKNTMLEFEHWSNVVQQQVDGGLVGVPWNDERGLRIDFKQRDVYYPHEDGLGADLAYQREFDEKDYLHVYRERVEKEGLRGTHSLYRIVGGSRTEKVDEAQSKTLLGLNELETFYKGRTRPFIVYWPNEKTFNHPLGVSCLKGQEAKQDEINWTLTRNAITFERNGKPRLAVSKEIFQALQDRAHQRYGDENKIDHRDLEITTLDDNGKAMEVIQIDITRIGDIQWVKDLMKMMFVETKTSEKAVDFYMDEGSGAAQTGVAKFYDLFISIVKAEQIQGEYIYFLQQLFENCLWLAHDEDPSILVEEPEISIKSMIPISRKELIEENNKGYVDGTQSLETTVRRNNPHASDEWIQEEVTRIEEEQQSDDTSSLVGGRSNLMNFMDNRDGNGDPVEEPANE
ncbi:hypothetical protein [Halobacillus sp. A5]|uniref:hypothetical protein n=1 Tax=Halobacillus sp. A5 TaxID=2880263 RepID=UPI0020A64AEC|nr:hypothetical protein [Halobacillus sp. A5]MCP3026613.1 hypothetical protein [Halobacillus sp. A5]